MADELRQFATTFAARAGTELPHAVAEASSEEVDEIGLRDSIAARLASGEFRLVVAVDAITPELRRIIEYLNEHTLPAVQVLAVELTYGRDDDVEFLIPAVYGEESAARKTRAAGGATNWNAESFAEQLNARTTGGVRTFIDRLLQHGSELPGSRFASLTPSGPRVRGARTRPTRMLSPHPTRQ